MSSKPSQEPTSTDCSSSNNTQHYEQSFHPPCSNVIISSVKQSLWDETGHGLVKVLANVGNTWYGDHAVYYTRERERLGSYLQPLYYGAAATVIILLGFRISGHPQVKQWRQRIWEQFRYKKRSESSSTTLSHSIELSKKTSTTVPPSASWYGKYSLEPKRITEPEEVLPSTNRLNIITDFLVSISVGLSGTLFMLQAKRNNLRNDYEMAPLVPGQSLVADQMCPGMLRLCREKETVQHVLRRNEQSAPALQDRNLVSFLYEIVNNVSTMKRGYERNRASLKTNPLWYPTVDYRKG
jgi:hypothetical protein